MKKTILCLVVLFTTLGCRKDADLPKLEWSFKANFDVEKISSGLGTNDVVPITFSIERDYNKSISDEITYKIEGNSLSSVITNRKGDVIKENETFSLTDDTVLINYKGLEQGEHIITFTFKNNKGYEFKKQVFLTFKTDFFDIGSSVPAGTLYQGQDIQYDLQIIPANGANPNPLDKFQIMFVSYDEKDPKLEKSYIVYSSQKVELGKWYDIVNIKNFQVITNSFHADENRILTYIVKNKTGEKRKEIRQDIKNRELILSNQINHRIIKQQRINDGSLYFDISISGIVTKKPKLNNNVQYRTILDSENGRPTSGLTGQYTNGEYKDLILEGDVFKLNMRLEEPPKKTTEYKLNIQFKDEFGNESALQPIYFTIKPLIEILGASASVNFKWDKSSNSGGIFDSYTLFFWNELSNQEIYIKAKHNYENDIRYIDYKFSNYPHNMILQSKIFVNTQSITYNVPQINPQIEVTIKREFEKLSDVFTQFGTIINKDTDKRQWTFSGWFKEFNGERLTSTEQFIRAKKEIIEEFDAWKNDPKGAPFVELKIVDNEGFYQKIQVPLNINNDTKML